MKKVNIGGVPEHFNLAWYLTLRNGEYKKALNWINKLINNNYGNVRMDLQCMSRIINIAIHYELGNYDLIPSLVRSSNRFLTKVDRKFKAETSFLKFANKNLSEEFSPKMHMNFQKEIDSLTDITKDSFEQKIIEYFDLISWLKTKTENRTMEEIISGKTIKEKLSRGIL